MLLLLSRNNNYNNKRLRLFLLAIGFLSIILYYTCVLIWMHNRLDQHHHHDHHRNDDDDNNNNNHGSGTDNRNIIVHHGPRKQMDTTTSTSSSSLRFIGSELEEANEERGRSSSAILKAAAAVAEQNRQQQQQQPRQQERLPAWIREYFAWHAEQIPTVRPHNWETKRYLIMTCFAHARKCGGVSDRLSSLPFMVRIAAETRRILLIHWGRPCALQEFFMPPQAVGGVDWRVPDWLYLRIKNAGVRATTQDAILAAAPRTNVTVLRVRFQSHDHGADYYDAHRNESYALIGQQPPRQQQERQRRQQQEKQQPPTFRRVFSSIWHAMFTPSVALARRVERVLDETGLVPGAYGAIHLRALYQHNDPPPEHLQYYTRVAVNCTTAALLQRNLQRRQEMVARTGSSPAAAAPRGAIYFASDSVLAKQEAVTYGTKMGIPVYTSNDNMTQPLHLDKEQDWWKHSAADYMDAFVDLYMLSLGGCVSYGMGGYGLLAARMSKYASSCALQYMNAVGTLRCPFAQLQSQQQRQQPPKETAGLHKSATNSEQNEPLFIPPMPPLAAGVADAVVNEDNHPAVDKNKNNTGAVTLNSFNEGVVLYPPDDFINAHSSSSLTRQMSMLWHYSTRLPVWIKDYFDWHAGQRGALNKKNWKNWRFLVMVCLVHDQKEKETTSTAASGSSYAPNQHQHCGGTADRLRPIPFMIRVAAQTRRILLIYWERPHSLESFLVPPAGGMDWRAPSWMIRHIHHASAASGSNASAAASSGTSNNEAVSTRGLVQKAQSMDPIVLSRVQAHDHGNTYYNQQGQLLGEPWDAFRQHYHDIWYTLFTPVPDIADVIEREMERARLVPGEYAAAHVRAFYPVQQQAQQQQQRQRQSIVGDRPTVGRKNELFRATPENIKNWTVNAIDCASELRPGGPIYVASDSALAKRVAAEYGRQLNASVVVSTTATAPAAVTSATAQGQQQPYGDKQHLAVAADPLHLDLAAATTGTAASAATDYYDIFVDLYLISMGRCISFNVGGFGKWGQLISGRDFTCNIRQWSEQGPKRKMAVRSCRWTTAAAATTTTQENHPALKLSGQEPQSLFKRPLFLPPMERKRQ